MKRVSGDVLGSLGDPGLRRSLQAGIRLQRVWEEALGEQLAGVLRPGRLAGGCLEVQVASSAWLMESRFLEPRLLRVLKKALPDLELRSIEFELAPRETPRPDRERSGRPPPRPRKPLGEGERSRIRELVREVRDPELRDGLSRFFEKVMARSSRVDDEERSE